MADERESWPRLRRTNWRRGGRGRPAPAVPQVEAVLRLGARTDLGQVRENNEDKFDFIEPDDPAVLAPEGRASSRWPTGWGATPRGRSLRNSR